jgi:Ca2+/Na+ antiporter
MMTTDILVGFLILTLFVYVLIMCSNNKFNSTDCMLIGIALVLLLVVYMVYMRKVNHMERVEEGFQAASLDYKMGKFTGLDVMTNEMPYDNLTTRELVEQNKVIYHSPVGSAHSLKPDPAASCHHPSVDGTKTGPKAMAMLAYNRSSPDCCPSTYSNSMGCICMSEGQKDYLGRGGRVVDAGNKLISGAASNDL